MQVRDLVFCPRGVCGLGYYREPCYNYLISVHVQPEDGQHQWRKHVVVLNPLSLLFKTLLHGQKDCVFSAGI